LLPAAGVVALCAGLLAGPGGGAGALAIAPAARVNIEGESRILTADPAGQIEPAISGDLIAFTDLRNGNADIYLYDLALDREERLTSGAQDEGQPDISGRTVVYTDFGASTGGGDVMMLAIGEAPVAIAADPSSQQTNPAIDGSLVAWEDWRDGNQEIYARDLATGVTRRITTTPESAEAAPSVSGSRIAYARQDPDGTCQIVVSDFATGESRQITDAATCFGRPGISGTTVVFDGNPPDPDRTDEDLDVHYHLMDGGVTHRIVLAGPQWNAHVDGDWLSADKEAVTPRLNTDVKLYNIPNDFPFGAVITEFNEAGNDISGRRAAYETDERGNLDIGVFEFTVAGENEAPVADAGADRLVECADPAGTAVTLDGSASSDPEGDPMTYTWTGPFPEGGGVATGAGPTVTLPLGASVVTLVVSDGEAESDPDAQSITVGVRADGMRPPLASMAAEGQAPPMPARDFRRGSTLPLKVSLSCGGAPLTAADVAAPRLAGLTRRADPVALGDTDAGRSNGGGPSFRASEGGWIYNLDTRSLGPGTYTLSILLPDGRRLAAGFALR
jgi:beta propeller repeat protein